MTERTCCFIGHRQLPANMVNDITVRLNEVIEQMIRAGVTTFISGGGQT